MDWLDHDRLGFNYRLTRPAGCAIGLAQLDRLDGMLADRARVAGWYREALRRLAAERGLGLPCEDGGRRPPRLVRLRRPGPARRPDRDDVDPRAARARHPVQALPAGDPPHELLPRGLRPPRGRVPGLRGRRRAVDRAAVLPAHDARIAGRSGWPAALTAVLDAEPGQLPVVATTGAHGGEASTRQRRACDGARAPPAPPGARVGAVGFALALALPDGLVARRRGRDRQPSSSSSGGTSSPAGRRGSLMVARAALLPDRGRRRPPRRATGRFYAPGAGAWVGWGVTLYLLGFALATQVAQIADVRRPLVDSRRPCPASPSRRTPPSGELNTSLGFDQRLWPHDIAQSRAHATMLAAQGIIGDDDRDAILAGLDAVEAELRGGTFPFAPDDEDIHMAVERRLTEIAGPVGGKLHTARSRNDQVATDVALFTRAGRARRPRRSSTRSWRRWSTPPSATSTGRCPATRTCSARSRSTCRHHLLAYVLDARARPRRASRAVEAPRRPAARRRRAGRRELRHRPPAWSPRELGFDAVSPNSIDAVSNRDFVLDFLSAAATCATHLSRLGAELVLWSSSEFGFVTLPDAWSSRLVDHAPEEEPRRRRAPARQGAAGRRPPARRCTA